MKERMIKLLRLVAIVLVAMLVGSVGAAAGPADGNSGEGGGQGQLEEQKVRARPVFEIEGVVFTDADETRNLLVVGVVNKGLAKAVEQRLKQLGIPLSSVEIVETKPIVFVTTLQDNGPPEGGLQIAFVDGGLAYLCTLGFNAVRAGVKGFVVNSHCTTDQFKVDGTNHYQPWLSPSTNLIGNEIADPSSFKCNVKGKKCRYSDAAYDQLADKVQVTLGSIAKPTGVNDGSLEIAGSFSIVGEAAGETVEGTILNKVGRTTGWTRGPITKSCVDTGVFRTNILLLCQDFVKAGVGGGDSGSPVFQITSDNDVTLYGILWGGASDGSFFVYSPILNIEKDLGELTTFGAAVTGSDLAVSKAVDNATPSEGDTITYTVTLTNKGPDDATSVVVTDQLPDGVSYLSDDGGGAYTPATGVWTVGSVANGVTATLTITATVDADTSGQTITNTATITAAGQTDPDSTNNSASADITVASATTGTMHVGDLDGSSNASGKKGWKATVTITVHDASHALVADATVSGSWSNGASGTATCTTDSSGQCSVTSKRISNSEGSVTFTVNTVTHATLTYRPADNDDPFGDTIAVLKP
ncbi:MAG: DUF11 domain-containing protein [Chloroflexi bacterium]|nr:MAG: DUF11 domain-containing protein [Chloroflexota bacterium]